MDWKADKIKHYKAGFMIMRSFSPSALFLLIATFIPWFELKLNGILAILCGSLFLTVLAGGKEIIYDKLLNKGTPEWDDFKATMIGGLDGLLIWKKSRF